MATFETKISGEVGELDKGALSVEVNNNDVATPEKESNGSEAVINSHLCVVLEKVRRVFYLFICERKLIKLCLLL